MSLRLIRKTEISLGQSPDRGVSSRIAGGQQARRSLKDQWTLLERSIFPDFIDIIQKKDAQAFADYMRCFFRQKYQSWDIPRRHGNRGLRIQARPLPLQGEPWMLLLRCANPMGLLRVENPEQGHYGENLFRTPDDLVNLLESFLKIDVVPPNASGRNSEYAPARAFSR